MSGFTLLSLMHILEVGRLISNKHSDVTSGGDELRQSEGDFLQAANTHSNTHMHLNTFLPFVYAVSMVRVVLIKLNDNLSSQIGYAYGLMFLVIERYLFVIFPKRHEW